MRIKEHCRKVRDEAVETCKAGFGYYIQTLNITWAMFKPLSKLEKTMLQLQTHHDHGGTRRAADFYNSCWRISWLVIPQICSFYKSEKRECFFQISHTLSLPQALGHNKNVEKCGLMWLKINFLNYIQNACFGKKNLPISEHDPS